MRWTLKKIVITLILEYLTVNWLVLLIDANSGVQVVLWFQYQNRKLTVSWLPRAEILQLSSI